MKYIIIGGGISGLFMGIMLKKAYPDNNVLIVEKNHRLGGRVFTRHHPDGSVFESGAGRFGMDHKILMSLLKRYKFTSDIITISNEIDVVYGPNLTKKDTTPSFESILQNIKNDASKDLLETKTIAEIAEELYGKDAERMVRYGFEYESETQIARASTSLDTIINTFRGEFGVLKGGLTRLIDAMESEFIGRGGSVLLNTKCTRISKIDLGGYNVEWENESGVGGNGECDRLLLCSTRRSVMDLLSSELGEEELEALYGDSVLTDQPLMRVYMRFPESWLDRKVTTRKAIRYILPVNKDPAIVMISYTDGPMARIWMNMRKRVGDIETAKEIMNQIRELFPKKKIPDPLWVSYEDWEVGASYWTPGTNDVHSKQIQDYRENPMENLYVCSEFTSINYHAWIEGALERCMRCLRKLKN